MTAPPPASAPDAHGFVNGSGILLTSFQPPLFASHSCNSLIIGVTAVIAQFTKLLQVNIKQKLMFYHRANGFYDHAMWFRIF
jgi:NAD(P)H-quinone oxidoreductase subunit 5